MDDTNATTVLYTQTPDVYGLLISRKRSSLPITEIYNFDALGSVSGIVISPLGGKLATYLYRAFGETTQLTGTIQSPFRWVGALGYYYDLDLLEYYLRARYYSPALARFLSQDPIGFSGGDFNLFTYARNNPLNTVDPTSGFAWPSTDASPDCLGVPNPTITVTCLTSAQVYMFIAGLIDLLLKN